MSNMQPNVLTQLLAKTWSSPVFGDSFGVQTPRSTKRVLGQVTEVLHMFEQDITGALAIGMPGASSQDVQKIVEQIAPKTVTFGPALTAGEVERTDHLAAVAVAIGLMYWGDQTMDRGDAAMPYAIELFAGKKPTLPKKLVALAKAQSASLSGIDEKVTFLSRPEDRPYVLACFSDQVLVNEVTVQRLSQQYLKASDKKAFLAQNGKLLAELITIDAGFPTVSSSLYALYRQQDPTLPSLAEVYADQTMTELLQKCNVAVRILDELGDWEMDSGARPEWGIFTLNPFNQPHQTFVGNLLALGGLKTPDLSQAFTQFHSNRAACGKMTTNAVLEHIKTYVRDLPPSRFDQYVVLCKRVLEIGYINRIGDIALTKQ